jgi:transposase
MSEQNKHKRPQYTLEFKKDAAKLVNEKGYAHQQAADNLGVSLGAIGRWVRTEKGPTVSVAKKAILNLTDQSELTRLRKEVEQLRMERDILKRPQSSLPKNSNKIRIYSRATEDISRYRAVQSHAGQYQRLLCVEQSA